MNIVVILAILTTLGGVGFIVWDKHKTSKKFEKVIVNYSEKVGDTIVEHDKQYIGFLDYENDLFKVKDINLTKPIPEAKVFIPTRNGNKKVNIIKIDSFRYGFRVPKLSNQIYIQKRDDYGNLLKTPKGKPILTKYKWHYCDDIVEPDVKHWNENVMEKLRQKHRTKADRLNRWILPISMAIFIMGAIITIQMTTKFVMEAVNKQVTLAEGVEETAKENTGLIQNIIKKMETDEPKPGGG